MSAPDAESFVEIPAARLSPEALRRLIEEFVTRDGTDYGRIEKTVEQKVADIMRQLRRREIRIMFDPQTQTTHLVITGVNR